MRIKSPFRTSKSFSNSWNLLKTIFQIIVFWLVFLNIIPNFILKIEATYHIQGLPSFKVLGIVLLLVFSWIGLYSGFNMSWYGKGTPLPFDCPNELVITGPYRYVRNPMAVAGIGQGISIGLYFGSFMIIGYSILGGILWHTLVKPTEESDLAKRFGPSYLAYKDKVKCWIPRF